MKKIILLTTCALILSGCSSNEITDNGMAYKEHLIKAEKALTNIEEIISDSPQTALIPIAKADANDDQAIVDNAETATEEINEAQKDVNSIGDEAAHNEAQREVNETKTEASETFDAAREATENPETQTELDALQEELDKIVPTPDNDSNAANPNPGNQSDEESMRADRNSENEDDTLSDDEPAEDAVAEATKPGEKANYDAFKAKTGVDFKPIYEGNDDSPFDQDADNILQDAEQDLQDRAKVDEPAQLEEPVLDEAAIEKTMQEIMQ